MANRYLINSISLPNRRNTLFRGAFTGRIERNPGDMVYTYAVMNSLATDNSVEFIPTDYYYFKGLSDKQVDYLSNG